MWVDKCYLFIICLFIISVNMLVIYVIILRNKFLNNYIYVNMFFWIDFIDFLIVWKNILNGRGSIYSKGKISCFIMFNCNKVFVEN